LIGYILLNFVPLYQISKSTKALIGASKEVGLEINVEKTKYTLLSRHQNVDRNRDIKIGKDRLEMCHSSNIWGRQKLTN
jgi:hypothetical protein